MLLETLGIGGMGTVYKARDTLLDREVALKLLRDDLGGEVDHAARLQHEARVAASVNHPNVIQVFSSGTAHGKFYLVMNWSIKEVSMIGSRNKKSCRKKWCSPPAFRPRRVCARPMRRV
ncbi:MAG: protein kinase [Spartobacteria bacterium]